MLQTLGRTARAWPEACGGERLTGAILDRLTHRVRILEANGESYRLRDSKRRLKGRKGQANDIDTPRGAGYLSTGCRVLPRGHLRRRPLLHPLAKPHDIGLGLGDNVRRQVAPSQEPLADND